MSETCSSCSTILGNAKTLIDLIRRNENSGCYQFSRDELQAIYELLKLTQEWQVKIKDDFNDWFLPNGQELSQVYANIHLYGLGNFDITKEYWTSNQASGVMYEKTSAISLDFASGAYVNYIKTKILNVRPVRTYQITEATFSKNIRDIGEANGYIFYRSNDGTTSTYHEVYHSDISATKWSNVLTSKVNNLLTTIGEGNNNSLKIVAQTGHTGSAAEDCLNLTTTEYLTVPILNEHLNDITKHCPLLETWITCNATITNGTYKINASGVNYIKSGDDGNFRNADNFSNFKSLDIILNGLSVKDKCDYIDLHTFKYNGIVDSGDKFKILTT